MCCAEEVRPGEGAAGQKCGHFFQSGFRKRSYEIIMPAAAGGQAGHRPQWQWLRCDLRCDLRRWQLQSRAGVHTAQNSAVRCRVVGGSGAARHAHRGQIN